MRALIWLIGIFAAAAAVAMFAAQNEGYVLLVAPPWRLQLSLNLLVVIIVAGFVLTYLTVRLLRRTLQLPGQVARWRERRRRERAGRALTDSVSALFEGRYLQSLKCAERAYGEGEGGAMAALVAARASHALQDDDRYRTWLEHSTRNNRQAEVARLMTEAELAIEAGRYQEAEERLAILREKGQQHVAMLRLEARAAFARGEWASFITSLRQLRKNRGISEEMAAPLLRRAHVHSMRGLAGDGEALAAYWKEIPAQELQDRELIERVLPLLAETGRGELARKQVERLLDEGWDSELARQYAYCAAGEGEGSVRACLQKAEAWLKQQPRDAGLLFALGQLCISAQLWGKAQSYLEASVRFQPTIEAHLALARLLEKVDRPQEAQACYRAAAEMVASKGEAEQETTLALLPA
ncbi:MAG: heme biosynthesis HemY N-terminal domain-containing protein [Thauera sp.]|nr:heme biosynthesis HemY N-terminal domain-containing protein [Thauera sp.]